MPTSKNHSQDVDLIKKAINLAGGPVKVARQLDCKSPAVSKWKKTGVPPYRVIPLCEMIKNEIRVAIVDLVNDTDVDSYDDEGEPEELQPSDDKKAKFNSKSETPPKKK